MRIEIIYRAQAPRASKRVSEIQAMFGIGLSSQSVKVADGVEISLNSGEILLITGPSGSGKSSLLRAIKTNLLTEAGMNYKSVIDISDVKTEEDIALIDSLGCSLSHTLELLSFVGLGEAFLMLRRFDELSEGQKMRFRLAVALSESPRFVIADEFCSSLDRLTARVVSYNLCRIAKKLGIGVICATANDDIESDLKPDFILRPECEGRWRLTKTEYKTDTPISFYKSFRIRRGTISDWKKFAHLHYKSHSTGIVDKVFTLYLGEEPIGVVVYAYPMGACRLRNLATGNRYCGGVFTAAERKRLLNREVRVVQRIVIDPRFRGLGLASAMLRSTIPHLGVRFVECLAVMGGYSRFLEKAGFVCVGRVSLPKEGRLLLGELRGCDRGCLEEALHDEQVLYRILKERSEKSAVFAELLRRWFRQHAHIKGAKNARFDFEKVAKALSKELSSRPFYFICDTDELIREGGDDSSGTSVIPVDGE